MSAAYRSRTGITIDEYDARLAKQGGGCAVCGRPPKTRRLHVDHDHATGAIRGLLCYRCNRAIPAYLTLDRARAIVAYLQAGSLVDTAGNARNGRQDDA